MKKVCSLILAILISLGMVSSVGAAQTPQIPIAGNTLPQFVDPLPLLTAANGTIQTIYGNQPVTIRMCEFRSKVLPSTFVPPVGSTYAGYTWVWGYLPDPTGSSTCADLIAAYGDANGILDTYLGPVILNTRGSPTDVTWINDLGSTDTTQLLFWKHSTDQTLHWADPLNFETNMCNHMGMAPVFGSECAQNYSGPIPAVIHLHGGEVPPEIDGGPDAWVTSDGNYRGHGYYTFSGAPANGATYRYPNTQEAAPIWFHDHVLGATRLNVYAGLAGGYLLSDPAQQLPAGLASYGLDRGTNGPDELTVPLVIQDRMFDSNGQLFFPSDSAGGVLASPNPDHPYWVPEFVGDTILVNGKVWPYLNVEPKRYRFLLLNGSNARTYEMNIIDPLKLAVTPNFWVIGTDGGYLDIPVSVNKLVIMPGERYEVIIDFSGVAPGTNLIIKNTAKTPYPRGAVPNGATTGQILQFRVGNCTSGNCAAADVSFNPAAPGTAIRAVGQTIVRLPGTVGGSPIDATTVQKTRAMTLNEVMGMPMTVTDPVTGAPNTAYPGGPLEILVNNTKWSGESPRTYNDFTPISVNGMITAYSELPQEGETEIWEIINLTADAHPIHLHLVQFQLVDRQSFAISAYLAAYNAAFPAVTGDPVCTGKVYCPGFGPPLDYNPSALSGGKYGGNLDVRAMGKNGKPVYLQGKPSLPAAYESGWKDTVIVYPGEVARIAVRWAPTDLPTQTTGNLGSLYYPFDPSGNLTHGYVWHCHIIDHEDNEMMRPDLVLLNPVAPQPTNRLLKQGSEY